MERNQTGVLSFTLLFTWLKSLKVHRCVDVDEESMLPEGRGENTQRIVSPQDDVCMQPHATGCMSQQVTDFTVPCCCVENYSDCASCHLSAFARKLLLEIIIDRFLHAE